jgi:hypothetical protein
VLPRQNFASVAEGQHRKILTGSWQPLISLEICSYSTVTKLLAPN